MTVAEWLRRWIVAPTTRVQFSPVTPSCLPWRRKRVSNAQRSFIVRELPPELSGVRLAGNLATALTSVDAAVLCTEWPQFRQAAWLDLLRLMRQPLLVDANRFLEKELKEIPGVEHLSVGRT